jgi:hypothetical protein
MDTAKIRLGSLLTSCVEEALKLAAEDDSSRSDFPSTHEWLLVEIVPNVVPAGENDIERLLADTPDLLAYPIALDDLYPMEVVTPGWFIGEAAYRAVSDAVREKLGPQQESPPSY